MSIEKELETLRYRHFSGCASGRHHTYGACDCGADEALFAIGQKYRELEHALEDIIAHSDYAMESLEERRMWCTDRAREALEKTPG